MKKTEFVSDCCGAEVDFTRVESTISDPDGMSFDVVTVYNRCVKCEKKCFSTTTLTPVDRRSLRANPPSISEWSEVYIRTLEDKIHRLSAALCQYKGYGGRDECSGIVDGVELHGKPIWVCDEHLASAFRRGATVRRKP